MTTVSKLFVVCSVLIVSACTWVDLTAEGEKVRVLELHEVNNCQLLGQTTATTKAKAVGVRRHEKAINYELTSLARNAAANLNGDTVVADGPEADGKQTFKVYRCVQ